MVRVCYRSPHTIQRIEGIGYVLSAAVTAHAADEQLIAIRVVRLIGIGHHGPLCFLSDRAITAAALSMRRRRVANNRRLKRWDVNGSSHDAVVRPFVLAWDNLYTKVSYGQQKSLNRETN